MEEFFLGGVTAANELDVVDHQHIDRPELFLERHRVLESNRPDELEHELFGREVDDLAMRRACADMPCDRMHQMGLTQTDAAIKEERVERQLRITAGTYADLGFGDPARGRMGELV